jgi:membrane-associated protease RseP (regulator of RpoE activity)
MAALGPAPPHVSRETRLLLITLVLSLVALWVLARIRFPERVASPNPLPPVLTQLSRPAAFDDLAATVFAVEPQVRASLMSLDVRRETSAAHRTDGKVLALRIHPEVAVAVVDEDTELSNGQDHPDVEIAGRDPASGLAVVRVRPQTVPDLRAWAPRQMGYPRFLIASDVYAEGISLRPVFVGSLFQADSPLWPTPIWLAPPKADLVAGTFVFTTDGALAGLVVVRDGRFAIVPGTTVMSEAGRLLAAGPVQAGRIGVEVQPLTAAVASATGALSGVVVTWVDPNGPASRQLAPGEIVEAIDGDSLLTHEHWQARIARLTANQSVVLLVRKADTLREVPLTAVAVSDAKEDLPLGLTLRAVQGTGVEVLSIQARSAAAKAGIEPRDVITVVGDIKAPTPTQVSRTFAAAAGKQPILVALTRAGEHHVLVLRKR